MAYERDASPLPASPEPPRYWRDRLHQYWRLVRGDRPIGWLLLLWPTWWGLWLAAEGTPPLWPLVVFSLGVWLTRSAGCVINDYADRWLDGAVERTRARPLVSGAVSGREALAVFELHGPQIDDWLSHLVDALAIPCQSGRVSRCRLADVSVLLLRPDPERVWLVADRPVTPYLGNWLAYAHKGTFSVTR